MSYDYLVGEHVFLTEDGTPWRVSAIGGQDDAEWVRLVDSRRPASTIMVSARQIEPMIKEHAHIDEKQRDCDGLHLSGRTMVPEDEHRRCEYGDIQFRNDVLSSVVNVFHHGRLDVDPSGFMWHEDTEEGSRFATVRWCDSTSCRDDKRWQRDLTAEAAGY